MQTPRPEIDPFTGHRRRILGKNRRLVHIALFEAHTLTVFKIDGRNQQHSNRVLSGKNEEIEKTRAGPSGAMPSR
ncbi:hypothetical protein GTC3P0254_51820 [Burkholderia pseudomallei]|nr:hypothetical protein GTC019_31790 [Burkholderia pseudomallei]BEH26022.1 hypothetical protein GTC050_32740 [Burkholderia pseudomallei]BEH44044.1 hypothetical protein KNG_32450 [Burkholderia pseudomallei]BEH49959.1 hypothetical protein TKS_31910 [Burkholderia pseudomallei]GEA58205.1 hypothetical protein GTC3P0254_51820 [Burkholderia pseudomallei]